MDFQTGRIANSAGDPSGVAVLKQAQHPTCFPRLSAESVTVGAGACSLPAHKRRPLHDSALSSLAALLVAWPLVFAGALSVFLP